MATIIKKGASPKTVLRKYREHVKATPTPKRSLRKYCGSVSLKRDPVDLQKEWRNEWK